MNIGLNGLDELNDLLFQILIVIFPILVHQLLWVEKHGIVESKKEKFISFLVYALTIALCMLFPIHNDPEHRFDLRMIPLTIGVLYLGNKAGFLLIIWMLLLRIFLGGYYGILHAIYNMLFYLPILFWISIAYQKSNRIKKFKLYFLLNLYFFVCFLVSSFQDNFILTNSHASSVFIVFVAITLTTSLILISFIENVQENLRMKAELVQSERMRLLSDLTGVFAHEIRNPMQVARGFLQLLHESDLPESKKEYIQISIEELDRANMIIHDFLNFSKPTTGDKLQVELKPHILRIINMVHTFSVSHNVHIHTHLSEGCWVKANPQRLNQCFINILKNAVESMPSGGEIDISCFANDQGYIEVKIQDQGIGMTKDQIHKLGTPYYSLKKNGTGLGMMVTLQIIQSYHGKLHIDSELGKGTTFSILLPQLQVEYTESNKLTG